MKLKRSLSKRTNRTRLAQTFFVGETNDIYVNSVDVFFFQTDETATVTFQIREMETGTPTQKVLSYSETIISGRDIVTSEDGQTPHTIQLKSPVYLAGGKNIVLF